jgi:malate synthase
MAVYDIPYYLNFLPASLLEKLAEEGDALEGVPGLRVAPGLVDEFPDLHSPEALTFVCDLYRRTRGQLRRVLDQRVKDREFIDDIVAQSVEQNAARGYLSPDYRTAIGRVDAEGRVPIGPLAPMESATNPPTQPVDIPEFLEGLQVTLFGPPDTEKMSINAMNAWHRRLPDESELVGRLVDESGALPRWGADNEDSKTPIMRDFLRACQNLSACFDRSISFDDEAKSKTYRLAEDHLARPIKRIPGLALPDGNHLLDGNPLPLHLVDFALHLLRNWRHEEALVFYIPKLENEEEAAYIKQMIAEAEAMLVALHPEYQPGSVRLFVVFENPRAIFRIREMAAALQPHFLGGSLGWHDFLASTARLFKNDPRYRIPVKADPDIVINHIKESHEILVRALEPMGAISIGGMYGVLFEAGNPASFEVSMVGYIKDVVTQLKRGLDGFWVAHPDFVRTGIALVEAYRRWKADADRDVLEELLAQLVPDPVERASLLDFVFGPDVPGLREDDPNYLRAVLAASMETSEVIANHDPEEVRYNVFQAVQYLADWLSGNGCVALPATKTNARGEEVFVRIMDDLATTERSRWELWAEVAHGRVPPEVFERILREELEFIRDDRSTETRRVQVRWQGEAARWYPVAARLLRRLVLTENPPEFVTEWTLPFTLDPVRRARDPWAMMREICPETYGTER